MFLILAGSNSTQRCEETAGMADVSSINERKGIAAEPANQFAARVGEEVFHGRAAGYGRSAP
jgi:hypothetical protein